MKKFSVRYEEDKTQINKVKVNNEAMLMIDADGEIEIRDEYHSINELYEHRMALNIALFNYWSMRREQIKIFFDPDAIKDAPPEVYKSKLHYDGTMFEGDYFVVCAYTTKGQISYHYHMKHWDKFQIPKIERLPKPYDGHTSLDVMNRLIEL